LNKGGEGGLRHLSGKRMSCVKKGNRIISFVVTQRRPMKGTFDQEPFEQFEPFVKSFKFLKKTFYEEMEEKIRELKAEEK
jgi:hypothetical protein